MPEASLKSKLLNVLKGLKGVHVCRVNAWRMDGWCAWCISLAVLCLYFSNTSPLSMTPSLAQRRERSSSTPNVSNNVISQGLNHLNPNSPQYFDSKPKVFCRYGYLLKACLTSNVLLSLFCILIFSARYSPEPHCGICQLHTFATLSLPAL